MSSLAARGSRQVIPITGNGAPQSIGGAYVLQYATLGVNRNNEYLLIFDLLLPPGPGSIPKLSLTLDMNSQNHFDWPAGVLFVNGLSFGVSTTHDLFTATGFPADYRLAFGRLVSP